MSATESPASPPAQGALRLRRGLALAAICALAACKEGRSGPSNASVAPSGSPSALAASGCPEGMIAFGSGHFTMGSPAGEGAEDEHPAHEVTLSAYCLDRTEVTVAAYRACVEEPRGPLRCKPPGAGAYCNGAARDRDDHPINCVDQKDAEAFCAWAGKRLPTEAEWERAARGGDEKRLFPWGNEAPGAQLCWDGEGSLAGKGRRQGTCPVGSFAKEGDPLAIVDLAGDVAEWVADAYAPYRPEPARDPKASDRTLQIGKRVVRGGSWFSEEPGEVRAARRDWFVATDRTFDVGFRCARDGG
ncbi:MAG: SUMF1/EgtB/PvdO family nonheme iron enzyme [Byssovorax sp.]